MELSWREPHFERIPEERRKIIEVIATNATPVTSGTRSLSGCRTRVRQRSGHSNGLGTRRRRAAFVLSMSSRPRGFAHVAGARFLDSTVQSRLAPIDHGVPIGPPDAGRCERLLNGTCNGACNPECKPSD
jgi:hypothetical protein